MFKLPIPTRLTDYLGEAVVWTVIIISLVVLVETSYMTSLSYGRVFCLESQKIDGTEYLRGSTDLAILFLLLNLEAWNFAGVYKIENK